MRVQVVVLMTQVEVQVVQERVAVQVIQIAENEMTKNILY